MEEKTFLSFFGEMRKTGLGAPNEGNLIHCAIVSISYYEHSEGEGSFFTIMNHIMVCLFFPYSFCSQNIFNLLSKLFQFCSSNLRLTIDSKQKYVKLRLQGVCLQRKSTLLVLTSLLGGNLVRGQIFGRIWL
jgi:hypothetical protein